MMKRGYMPKYIRYSDPVESRVQSRERWRKVYMRTYATKWLLLGIACAILLTLLAWRVWQGVQIWVPVAEAGFVWLYLAGGIVLSKIRGWRFYVSTIMYMEAIEDGLCKDRPFTWEGGDWWYRGTRFALAAVTRAGIHAGAPGCGRMADALKLEQDEQKTQGVIFN